MPYTKVYLMEVYKEPRVDRGVFVVHKGDKDQPDWKTQPNLI